MTNTFEPAAPVLSERQVTNDSRSATGSADRRRSAPRRSRADVQLIGRVGADPDVRFAGEGSGRAWARFRVATEAPDASEDAPDWHTVIVHDRLAQFVARYVNKGRLVHVLGWLTYCTVTGREGAHRVAEIRASNVLLLDRPVRSDAKHEAA